MVLAVVIRKTKSRRQVYKAVRDSGDYQNSGHMAGGTRRDCNLREDERFHSTVLEARGPIPMIACNLNIAPKTSNGCDVVSDTSCTYNEFQRLGIVLSFEQSDDLGDRQRLSHEAACTTLYVILSCMVICAGCTCNFYA